MKKIIIVLLFLIFVVTIWIYSLCNNAILGSNTFYHKEIFDYPDSEWVCSDPKIKLKVLDMSITDIPEYDYVGYPIFATMSVDFNEESKEYIMLGERGGIEIYEPDKDHLVDGKIYTKYRVMYGFAKYRKNILSKEITSFVIYDIREDQIFDKKYKKMLFKRKK